MKKLTTLVLALALAASLTVPAFSANTTTLTTSVPAATYTLNIPADQEIPFGATETNIGSISVTDGTGFAEGKNLKVTLTYDAFTSETVATKIPFAMGLRSSQYTTSIYKTVIKVSGESMIFEGKETGDISEFVTITGKNTGVNQGSTYKGAADEAVVTISSTDWGKALAGNYSATITFTAEVVSG